MNNKKKSKTKLTEDTKKTRIATRQHVSSGSSSSVWELLLRLRLFELCTPYILVTQSLLEMSCACDIVLKFERNQCSQF